MFATKIGCLKKKKLLVEGSFHKCAISLNVPGLRPAGRPGGGVGAAAMLLKFSWNAGVATGYLGGGGRKEIKVLQNICRGTPCAPSVTPAHDSMCAGTDGCGAFKEKVLCFSCVG